MINAELRKELTRLVNDAFDKGDAIALIAMAITLASRASNYESIGNIGKIIKTALMNMSSEEMELLRDILTNASPEDNEEDLSYLERVLQN